MPGWPGVSNSSASNPVRVMPSGRSRSVADVVRVRLARDGGDDPAQDRVAEIGVLELGSRRPVEPHAAGQEAAELLQRQALLPVAPRIVGREAGRHREQVPDRHAGRVRRHRRPAAQLGDVLLGRVVELEHAVVAQRQDRGRGEALGHRRDAEDRVGVRRRAAEVPLAEPGGVHQLAIQHDPVGQTWLPAALLIGRRQLVHVREIDHLSSLSEPVAIPLGPARVPSFNSPGTPRGRHETWR